MSDFTIQANLDIRDPIMISVSDFRGQPRLDIRHFFENSEGALSPTKKGINIPLTDTLALIDSILVAYNDATGKALGVFETE